MRQHFDAWIATQGLVPRTIASRCSELRRIEAAYGDLDALAAAGQLDAVLESLTYSRADADAGRENPSRIAIAGDVWNGLATLRTSLRLYRRFLATQPLR
ncbi:hypothetical protein RNZ50_13325 [Paracoccaceae bacterium Fryx2]|nr:hypothetical protein [Paracoccaceae bacterium Fryx2]